jgi:hypothetical protein
MAARGGGCDPISLLTANPGGYNRGEWMPIGSHLPAKVARVRFRSGGCRGASGSHFLPVSTEPFAVFDASNGPSSHSLPRLRIFVSSPGDVDTERQIAGRVIERLRIRFQEHG